MDKHILTLANSIIGVSILAMPYCFKQCGIVLAILLILLSNLITRLTSHFLIKSAIIARRKTFEYLAYYIFGGLGKFAIEVGIIGFLIGTCIAFFVVMGDLGPEIISEISGQDASNTMRSSILMALALFCVLPLGLLRNIDSLSGVSRATIGFYFCLILKIVFESLPHLFSGDWLNKVEIWRPAGVIQCLPIFSMALSCQTQLFEIYQVVHNPTLEKMNRIVKNAINICTLVYIFVGFFGYIAFAKKNFTGNILISFAPSFATNAIKLGFILSIAFSFPLVIFPCRASIHSLIYREGFSVHEGASNYIPEGRFKGITLIIVFFSLIVGILIPNIELVLGLVGSTIGIAICILFPLICYIYISEKNTNERLLAKVVLVVGIIVMILGTYENLHSLENIDSSPVVENLVTENRELKIIDPVAKDIPVDIKVQTEGLGVEALDTNIKKSNNQTKIQIIAKVTNSPEIRHEPPQPIEPQDSQQVPEETKINQNPEEVAKENVNEKLVAQDAIQVVNIPPDSETLLKLNNSIASVKKKTIQQEGESKEKALKLDLISIQNNKANDTKSDQVDIEAIKKDDKEIQLQQKEKREDSHFEEHRILLDSIQRQNEVQEEIVKQQKKLIEVIEQQQDQKAKEEKLKAVKEIEIIALQAIEKISSDVKNNERVVAELQETIHKVNSNENDQKPKDNLVQQDAFINKVGSNENGQKPKDNLVQQDTVINKETLNNLKLANRMQSRDSNITAKETIESIDKSISKNLMTSKKYHGVSNNSLLNANPKLTIQLHNKTNNVNNTAPFGSKIFNNTAPLFINLGPKSNNDKEPVKSIMPLPIVVSNLKQFNNKSENNISAKGTEYKSLHKSSNEIVDEEAKVMRRDILAYMISKKRR